MNCRACGRPLPAPPWFRRDECPHCGESLHSCVYCFFFAPGHHNECREPMADRVTEKERSNFCDYFKPGTPGGSAEAPKGATLSSLEALFKK